MIKKTSGIILCLVIILLGSNTKAQVTTAGYTKDFFEGSTALKTIRLNPNVIAFVSNDNNKAVEVNCTDNNSNRKWTARVNGYLQDVVVLGKNVLIIVSTDFTFFTRANSTYKGYLISGDKGTVIKEKTLFSGNNDYFTFPYSMISKDHKTYTLVTRETAVKRTVKIAPGFVGGLYLMKTMSDQANKVRAFNVLTFDENLEETTRVSPDLPNGDFIGISKTINGDTYIAVSENKKGITISKYLPNKEKAVKSVTEPYSFYGGFLGMGHLSELVSFHTDTISNNVAYMSGSFKSGDDYITMFNKYDFEGNQHKRFIKSFTRSEVRDMEKAYTPLNKEFKKLKLAPAKNLELLDVVMHENGYFMFLSDKSYTTGTPNSPPVPYSEGIIVYNLDKNLAIQTISTIPRSYMGVEDAKLKIYSKKGSLYVLASHDNHANFMMAKINTKTGKLEDIQRAEPDKASKTDFASLSEAVMSDTKILLPVLDYKLAIGKIKFDVLLYQLGW